jgi:thiol-disulfide isomerase/thioredoxin
MSNVTYIRNKKEIDDFTKNKKAIIFYSAKYCPACMEIKPLYNRIANRYKDRVSFSIIDIEEAGVQLDTVPIFEGYYKEKCITMEGVDTKSLKQFIKAVINEK